MLRVPIIRPWIILHITHFPGLVLLPCVVCFPQYTVVSLELRFDICQPRKCVTCKFMHFILKWTIPQVLLLAQYSFSQRNLRPHGKLTYLRRHDKWRYSFLFRKRNRFLNSEQNEVSPFKMAYLHLKRRRRYVSLPRGPRNPFLYSVAKNRQNWWCRLRIYM